MKTLSEKHGNYTGYLKPPAEPSFDLPGGARGEIPLPQLNEVQVVRHFMELSRNNYGVDSGFYPLGSCTMKYNPKVNEDAARLEGFASLHPLSEQNQGSLELMHELEKALIELTGMDAFTLQPCAGAHGELAALMVAKAHLPERKKVLVPDTAHGTNPASAALCGFEIAGLQSNKGGGVDLKALQDAMSADIAVFMLTNPNTLGLFEEKILEVADIVHSAGALMYCDGANMNAMLGITRPGDQGFDMMHLNLHKTFATPHGGGGPGSGPVGVKKPLEKYLPAPRVVKKGSAFVLEENYPDSIGSVHAFFGNFGIMVRAYAYILSQGNALKRVSQNAVLNANYVMRSLEGDFEVPYNRTCAHECVLAPKGLGDVHTMDLAKRLLDYGYHAPTIYFPLIVHEAIMIEPTETEDKATLDAFCETMRKIVQEAKENPELVKKAPHTLSVGRLDGVQAARKPNLRWQGVANK